MSSPICVVIVGPHGKLGSMVAQRIYSETDFKIVGTMVNVGEKRVSLFRCKQHWSFFDLVDDWKAEFGDSALCPIPENVVVFFAVAGKDLEKPMTSAFEAGFRRYIIAATAIPKAWVAEIYYSRHGNVTVLAPDISGLGRPPAYDLERLLEIDKWHNATIAGALKAIAWASKPRENGIYTMANVNGVQAEPLKERHKVMWLDGVLYPPAPFCCNCGQTTVREGPVWRCLQCGTPMSAEEPSVF